MLFRTPQKKKKLKKKIRLKTDFRTETSKHTKMPSIYSIIPKILVFWAAWKLTFFYSIQQSVQTNVTPKTWPWAKVSSISRRWYNDIRRRSAMSSLLFASLALRTLHSFVVTKRGVPVVQRRLFRRFRASCSSNAALLLQNLQCKWFQSCSVSGTGHAVMVVLVNHRGWFQSSRDSDSSYIAVVLDPVNSGGGYSHAVEVVWSMYSNSYGSNHVQ
jgi:hypothetical protein